MNISAVIWLLDHWGSFSFTARAPSENGVGLTENASSELFIQSYANKFSYS